MDLESGETVCQICEMHTSGRRQHLCGAGLMSAVPAEPLAQVLSPVKVSFMSPSRCMGTLSPCLFRGKAMKRTQLPSAGSKPGLVLDVQSTNPPEPSWPVETDKKGTWCCQTLMEVGEPGTGGYYSQLHLVTS